MVLGDRVCGDVNPTSPVVVHLCDHNYSGDHSYGRIGGLRHTLRRDHLAPEYPHAVPVFPCPGKTDPIFH
jgi:DNA polymerase II small subunit/DNA polymerase delta subunit B